MQSNIKSRSGIRDKKESSARIYQRTLEFCQQTSLHGWQYLQSEIGIVRKVLWFFLIFGHYIAAAYLIWMNYEEFNRATTITTIESTTAPLKDVRFPSVYVCNLNSVTKSFMKEINLKEKDKLLLMKEFVTGDKNDVNLKEEESKLVHNISEKIKNLEFTSKHKYNYSHIYMYSGQSCSEMILKLKWGDESLKYFYDSFWESTEYGLCCLITPHLDFGNASETAYDNKTKVDIWKDVPKGFAMNGLQSGLMMTLDLEHFDHAVTWDSIGFKIGLTDPRDKMIMRNKGIDVQPGELAEVGITPTITNTTEEAIVRFNPEDRNCYNDHELIPKFFPEANGYRYSLQNCLVQSMLDKVIAQCHCILYMNYLEVKMFYPTLDICSGRKELYCANQLLSRIGNQGMDKIIDSQGNERECLERCEYQQNDFAISHLKYPHIQTFKNHPDRCLVMEKIIRICAEPHKKLVFERYYKKDEVTCQELNEYYEARKENCDQHEEIEDDDNEKMLKFHYDYASENMAKVAIFLRNPHYTSIKRDVKMPTVEFISNTGGLLGLWLGLSFLSIFELFYHSLKCMFKI